MGTLSSSETSCRGTGTSNEGNVASSGAVELMVYVASCAAGATEMRDTLVSWSETSMLSSVPCPKVSRVLSATGAGS